MALMRGVPKMIEADAEQRPNRSEARDMSPQLVVGPVRLRHHHHRIPATERAYALLQRMIAGRPLLQVWRNRVQVRRVQRKRDVGSRSTRLVDQLLKQVMGALRALALKYRFQRVEPLLRLKNVGIVGGWELGSADITFPFRCECWDGISEPAENVWKLTP